MTNGGIEVEGAAELNRTMRDLGRNLTDLTPANDKAADLLLEKADPRTPRQDGSLAASGRSDADSGEATVSYEEIYAGVIHNGWPEHNIEAQPWLTETAADNTDALVDVYVDHVADLVGHVHGA